MPDRPPSAAVPSVRSPFRFAVLLVLAAPGCGAVAAGPSEDLAPAGDMKAPGYPAGPTGNQPGDIVPNFTFQGYFSPTKTTGLASAEPFGEINLDMMRTSGAKIAIIQTAAVWCGPCLQNAITLATKGAALVPRGLTLSLVLTDGNPPGTPVTMPQIDGWIERVPEYFTTFIDSQPPQPPLQEFWGIERDHFVIIDLATMKLIEIVPADPQAALDEASGLL